jgi:hypothetical protein
MNSIPILVLFAFVLCFCNYEGFSSKPKVEVVSKVDQRKYKVLQEYHDREVASDMIAQVNAFASEFLQHLHREFGQSSTDQNRRFVKGKRITDLLFKRWNTSVLTENFPDDPRFTSYTYNKGQSIALCLREQTSGQFAFHDLHLIKFVFLHELTHVATKSVSNDHGRQFMADFKFILTLAHEYGLYQPVNYATMPVEYCSIKVNYNPYFDNRLDALM